MTPRDYAGLRLTAALGAVRADDLGRYLAHHAGRDAIGARTTTGVLSRWHRLGLAEWRRIDTASPRAWAVTPLGAAVCGWSGPTGWPSLAEHRHTLEVAALAVGYVRAGAVWTAERSMTPADGWPSGVHRPDGIATRDGVRTAVECERSQKSRARWRTIVPALVAEYAAVDYWAPAPVASALAAWLPEILTPADVSRVRVLPLEGWTR